MAVDSFGSHDPNPPIYKWNLPPSHTALPLQTFTGSQVPNSPPIVYVVTWEYIIWAKEIKPISRLYKYIFWKFGKKIKYRNEIVCVWEEPGYLREESWEVSLRSWHLRCTQNMPRTQLSKLQESNSKSSRQLGVWQKERVCVARAQWVKEEK